MSLTVILLLLAGGLVILPSLGGDDDDDDSDGKNEILGGPGNDEIEGTDGNDLIRTFLGDDTIDGGDGNDDIRAGEGDDIVDGGAGIDFIRGGAGNDTINGGDGNDLIRSDRGIDTVDGGKGADIIRGGRDDDTIRGGFDVELVNGNPVGTFNAADELSGEVGNDTLFSWGGGGTVTGGGVIPQGDPDEDTLVLVTGEAEMSGGPQEDEYYVLANARDDQPTEAVIKGFNLNDDDLFMTIDYETSTTTGTPGVDVTYEDVPSDGTLGAGTKITIELNGPDAGNFAGAEESSVFLEGIAVSDLQSAGGTFDFQVYLTDNASYDMPENTLTEIAAATALVKSETFLPLAPAMSAT